MNPQNSPAPTAPAEGSGTGGEATETSDTLAETKNNLTQTARDAASKIKSAASNTATRAKEEAERFASEKKETTVGRIGSYSSAIHETARSLEEKDPNIAWFTHQAADKLQGVADYLRQRDLAALRHDAEDLARRHPAAFFGGMFLVGLLAGNVVKASRRKLDDHPDNRTDPDDESDWPRRQGENESRQGYLSDASNAQRAAADI